MNFFSIDNQKISYNQLKNFPLHQLNSEARQTVAFCQDWLRGKIDFSLQTSGSTGKPKTIKISRQQILASAHATNQILKLDEQDHFLVAMSTTRVGGLMMLVRGLEAKAAITAVGATGNPFAAYQAYKKPASKKWPTFTAMVPLQMQNILANNYAKYTQYFSDMKAILIGGGAAPSSLEEKIKNLPCQVYHTYGMTETVSHIALRLMSGRERSEYFTVLPEVDVKVNEKGCLQICAPMTNNQWLTTNDRVELTDQNTFKWLGRADFVINSGGIKIQSEQLENKIAHYFDSQKQYNLSKIPLFFVAGLPDEKLGEKVCLFIEGNQYKASDLRVALRLILNKYEVPKFIFNLDVFPLTASGKIDRQQIIRQVAG